MSAANEQKDPDIPLLLSTSPARTTMEDVPGSLEPAQGQQQEGAQQHTAAPPLSPSGPLLRTSLEKLQSLLEKPSLSNRGEAGGLMGGGGWLTRVHSRSVEVR